LLMGQDVKNPLWLWDFDEILADFDKMYLYGNLAETYSLEDHGEFGELEDCGQTFQDLGKLPRSTRMILLRHDLLSAAQPAIPRTFVQDLVMGQPKETPQDAVSRLLTKDMLKINGVPIEPEHMVAAIGGCEDKASATFEKASVIEINAAAAKGFCENEHLQVALSGCHSDGIMRKFQDAAQLCHKGYLHMGRTNGGFGAEDLALVLFDSFKDLLAGNPRHRAQDLKQWFIFVGQDDLTRSMAMASLAKHVVLSGGGPGSVPELNMFRANQGDTSVVPLIRTGGLQQVSVATKFHLRDQDEERVKKEGKLDFPGLLLSLIQNPPCNLDQECLIDDSGVVLPSGSGVMNCQEAWTLMLAGSGDDVVGLIKEEKIDEGNISLMQKDFY